MKLAVSNQLSAVSFQQSAFFLMAESLKLICFELLVDAEKRAVLLGL